jgi:hypothetical protein
MKVQFLAFELQASYQRLKPIKAGFDGSESIHYFVGLIPYHRYYHLDLNQQELFNLFLDCVVRAMPLHSMSFFLYVKPILLHGLRILNFFSP